MSDDAAGNPEKKIIIDEDWKSQVERERQEMREKTTSPDATSPPSVSEAKTTGDPPDGAQEFPPASFEQLVSMLASSAMVFLGQMPDPTQEEQVVNLPLASHYIEMLDVLAEKTQGNLSNDENAMLQTVTYQLRMAYVQVSK